MNAPVPTASTPTSQGDRVLVDLDELGAMVMRARVAAAELAEQPGRLGAWSAELHSSTLGMGPAAGAASHAIGLWGLQLRLITEDLDGVLDALVDAAATYESTERSIEAAAGPVP